MEATLPWAVAMATNYLTREGAAKLQSEMQHLLKVERPRIVQEVSDAAAQGDRSENAEYIYGKKRLREIDRRLRFLGKRLDSAVIVERETGADDVRFGASVEIEDEHGKRSRYRLVGPDEANPSEGRLSFKSPLGRALMKKRVGDVVVVERPAGDTEVEIISVEY